MGPNASNTHSSKPSLSPRLGRGFLLALMLLAASLALTTANSAAAKPRVLRVGSFHGLKGKYKTIQSAVDAAKPGDWVLVGPGDYHERGDRAHAPGEVPPAGVLILKPRVHLRGMNRNGVIVDGTKPGSAQCSRKPGAQDFGVTQNGSPIGRNGVVAFKASGVSIENLTA